MEQLSKGRRWEAPEGICNRDSSRGQCNQDSSREKRAIVIKGIQRLLSEGDSGYKEAAAYSYPPPPPGTFTESNDSSGMNTIRWVKLSGSWNSLVGWMMEELGKQIDELSNKVTSMRWEIWTQYTLFTWQWWMLVFLCIGIVVLFVVMIRKENLLKAFAYFGLVYIFNKNLDDLATAMDWYDYRMQLEPIIPTMLPANLFVIPGVLTILYIRSRSWKRYWIAAGGFSIFVSYVALPLMKVVKIYAEKAWNVHWSFISLVSIAVASKLIVDAAIRLQSRHGDRQSSSDEVNILYLHPKLWNRKRSRIT